MPPPASWVIPHTGCSWTSGGTWRSASSAMPRRRGRPRAACCCGLTRSPCWLFVAETWSPNIVQSSTLLADRKEKADSPKRRSAVEESQPCQRQEAWAVSAQVDRQRIEPQRSSSSVTTKFVPLCVAAAFLYQTPLPAWANASIAHITPSFVT